jgi:antitoxin component HigA of HigAB toxin-antitoxin module
MESILNNNFVDLVGRIMEDNAINKAKIAERIGVGKAHFCNVLKKRDRLTDQLRERLEHELALYLPPKQPSAD